jgi:pSer/pThr/pTyr-binding forkhead associated (FHA) protein
MSLLKILKEGQLVQQITLQIGKEYILGRSSSCDVVLDANRSISRQHLKIYSQGSDWKVESLSKFGELYVDGEKLEQIDLSSNKNFSVPPYEFIFETEAKKNPVEAFLAEADSQSFSDRTQIAVMQATAFLTAQGPDGQNSKIFQLEGSSWIGGRETSCALFLDDSKFSRQHFEIANKNGSYMVKDLGSSNGTKLNGLLISSSEWSPLVSGDVLTVADWNLQFELRDDSFDARIKDLPPEFRSPMVYQSGGPVMQEQPNPIGFSQGSPGSPFMGPPMGVVTSSGGNKNWVRIAIAAVLIIGAVGYFMGGSGKNQVAENKPREQSAFEKLKPEQQQYVRDTYRLADRLFKEGRYEMARQEITKIHELVPYYEESKNLEKLADVAIQTLIDQKRAEAKEQEQAEMEEKIQSTVAQCEKLINANIDQKKIEECLSPVIVLNPDHPAIAALRSKADQVISDRLAKDEEKAEYRNQVRRQSSLFAAAENLDKGGKPLEALRAYSKVISSRLPDPQNLKGKAQRQIASIQQKLTDQQSKFESEAESSFKSGDIKTAVQKMKKALAINPENEVLKGRLSGMISELKKQMQTLYQEGVLEESVGEVETAKAKWKKIIDSSLPEEDYYKKARTKLKKYGVE